MKTQKTMPKKTMTINTKTKTVTAMAMKTWGVVTQTTRQGTSGNRKNTQGMIMESGNS